MKKAVLGGAGYLLCWFALFLSNPLQAQVSDQQWINFSQTYFKIPVARDGIYRISYTDLQAAGVPIGSIDPRRINLFHRGNEQAILVQGQDDAQFDPQDYIEFYGQRNDGTLDAYLYQPGVQPHPYYNLFNDTTAYFLTWNPLPVQGKRMNSFTQANSASLPVRIFHNDQELKVYFDEYAGGYTEQSEIQSTAFDLGEGWTGKTICTTISGCTGQLDYVIDNLGFGATSSGLPQLELMLVGREEVNHQTQIYVGANSGSLRMVATRSFQGFNTSLISVPLDWADIGSNGKMTVRIQLVATGTKDLQSVSYIKVTFPQQWNQNAVAEKYFNIAPDNNNKSYVEIQNPPASARIWDVNDPNDVGTIGSVAVSGGIGAVIPGTASGKKLFVSSTTFSTTLQKVGFRSFPNTIPKYIIISHRSLMKPALGYSDVIKAYGGYRASAAGGSYDTLTVAMDQLYNQFNYGETSPRAIYQFMRYLTGAGSPSFLFLIGKGLEVSQGYYRKTSFAGTDFHDLVPSAGMPGADMAFTAGLSGSSAIYDPAIPTGRLTASTPAQVAAYLNKVKETEVLAYDALWRKDLLHLSGGINQGEPEIFRGFVDGFKAVAESIYLGGSVQTISKQTLNVELVNIKEQVNHGLNLITFFGHSGPGTIDIDIGYVSDPTLGYNNPGKYPGFLINGCNAGRFYDNRFTFGEDWVLTAGKGAKAFIAHSFFGFTNTLKQYSDIFYSVAYADSTFMKKGIGEIQKETARRYLNQSGAAISAVTQVQQMVLLGDPAVQLFGARKPDFAIDNNSLSLVSLDGKPVTAQSNSFALDIQMQNFGRTYTGPMVVRVLRTLNDKSVITYDSTINPVYYSGVIRFVIKKGRNPNEFGNNNFTVVIDPVQVVQELTKTNNTASLNFFIPLNGTKNLFPAAYSIVHNTNLDLVFQNTDLLSDTRSFKIEIDTAATFDSPYLNRKDISGKVLAKMNLNLLGNDSLIYYWRTKLNDPKPGESTDWTASSFIYIKNGPEGWGQFKYTQLKEDVPVGLEFDADINLFKFQEVISTIDLITYGNANPADYTQVSVKLNDEEFNVSTQGQPCRNNSLSLMSFDRNSTAPYAGIHFNFADPRDCGREPQLINNFIPAEMDLGNGQDLIQWVQNVIQGDSVVLFTIGDAGYASWTANVKTALAQLGISTTQLSSVQAGEPFVIFGKKGSAAGTAKIFRPAVAPANAQQLTVNKTLTGRVSEGSLTSVIIGPAQQWSQLRSQLTGATSHDIYGVNVTGIDLNGKETALKSQVLGTQSLTDINPSTYPYLKLTLQTSDDVDLTPVNLRKWLVTYTPVAEGMLTYSGIKTTETVEEGQNWKATYGFTNYSTRSFGDSLSVQVSIFTSQSGTNQNKNFRIKQPSPGDTTKFSFSVSTVGKAGPNDITVNVNPRILPEVYYDNNALTLFGHLNVNADLSAPVLDVTFDGRRLRNGDVISSNPSVVGKVIDQNPFLLKTDTVGINLFLQYPCASGTCPFQRINFSRKDISWKAATATSPFQVTFNPANLATGQYTLRMDAQDAKGNVSGATPYEVSFVISDKALFSLQSVYPNPSFDKFYFRMMLSGLAPPTDFQLRIYSSTGLLIRTFGNEVLPLLHVGTNDINISATDANGNKLPTGIYVFRLSTTIGEKLFTDSGRLMVVD